MPLTSKTSISYIILEDDSVWLIMDYHDQPIISWYRNKQGIINYETSLTWYFLLLQILNWLSFVASCVLKDSSILHRWLSTKTRMPAKLSVLCVTDPSQDHTIWEVTCKEYIKENNSPLKRSDTRILVIMQILNSLRTIFSIKSHYIGYCKQHTVQDIVKLN